MSKQEGVSRLQKKCQSSMKLISLLLPRYFVNDSLSPLIFIRWKYSFNEGDYSNLQLYSRHRNPEMDSLEEQIRILKNSWTINQFNLRTKPSY
jgi:hypothetical protein